MSRPRKTSKRLGQCSLFSPIESFSPVRKDRRSATPLSRGGKTAQRLAMAAHFHWHLGLASGPAAPGFPGLDAVPGLAPRLTAGPRELACHRSASPSRSPVPSGKRVPRTPDPRPSQRPRLCSSLSLCLQRGPTPPADTPRPFYNSPTFSDPCH